jgi:aryl carrier-like protein
LFSNLQEVEMMELVHRVRKVVQEQEFRELREI